MEQIPYSETPLVLNFIARKQMFAPLRITAGKQSNFSSRFECVCFVPALCVPNSFCTGRWGFTDIKSLHMSSCSCFKVMLSFEMREFESIAFLKVIWVGGRDDKLVVMGTRELNSLVPSHQHAKTFRTWKLHRAGKLQLFLLKRCPINSVKAVAGDSLQQQDLSFLLIALI